MKVAAVIAAGGTGTRMNAPVPKQFVEIAGKPVFIHTIERISSLEEVIQIILALPEAHIPAATAILSGLEVRIATECIAGGSNRQESVHRGVRHAHADADVIMVHDAVRPVCDRDTMRRVLDAAWEKGAAVPGLPATETIQRVPRKGRASRLQLEQTGGHREHGILDPLFGFFPASAAELIEPDLVAAAVAL